MNVNELREQLTERRIEIWLDGKMLRFRAPENALEPALLTQLQKHKKELIEILKNETTQTNDDSRLAPLSIGQQALYFLHAVAPLSPAYNVATGCRIQSVVDVDAMKKAFEHLISRHDSLRTTFELHDGQIQRRIRSQGQLDFEQVCMKGSSEEEVALMVRAEYQKPFDLVKGPLLRVRLLSVSESEHVFLMTLHHIVFDAWSLWLVQDEFRMLYQQYAGGETALLPELKADYSDFVREQDELATNERGELMWKYWRNQLGGDIDPLDVPLDHPRQVRPGLRGASHRFRVPSELSCRLRELAKLQGVTPYVLMLAIYKTLLHRYSGQDDLVVGTTTSGRSRTDFTRVVGYFVNALAIRTEASADRVFTDFLASVKKRSLEAMEHQDFPFPLLVDRLNPRRESGRPIFNVAFGFQKPQQFNDVVRLFDEDDGHIDWGGLEVHPYEFDQQEGQFDLLLEIFETNDSFMATLKYDVDLFDAETTERMGQHFLKLAEEIVDDPNRTLSEYEILPGDEMEQILSFAQSGDYVSNSELLPHRIFEQQAEKHPDRTAVIDDDGASLTYGELNRLANRFARLLQSRNCRPGTKVACRFRRNIDVAVSLLGIWKAGGAFVPLDAKSPRNRVADIVRDCHAELVLCHDVLAFDVASRIESDSGLANTVCVTVDDWRNEVMPYDDSNLDLNFSAEQTAYIIHTSGSTGKPKGVCVSHRALCQHMASAQETYQFTPEDRVLHFFNLTFDPAVEQFLVPLCSGATVVLRGDDLWSPDVFWQRLREHRITVVGLVPAYFRECTEAYDSGSNSAGFLRLIYLGGDVFPPELVGEWRDRGIQMLNVYGPTESVVTATAFDTVDFDLRSSRVPLGRPIPGRRAYVLDRHGRVSPIGVPGELHLGGPMLADGYLNDEAQTASRFVQDPFVEDSTAKMYRTGDRVRWLSNGNLEIIGRTDRQVKVNGFRVELGEVEAVLRTCPGLRDAFVQPRTDAQRDTCLVAWVCMQSEFPFSEKDVHEYLKTKLPRYMIPRQMIEIDEMPVNASGKVDRKALPEPKIARPTNSEFVRPRTEKEQVLADIWSKVLNVDTVGVNDNFFHLGGGSLTSLRIVAHANDAGLKLDGDSINAELLFEYPTVRELAAYLSQTEGEQ